MNMLLTCISYCDVGPGCDQNCLQVQQAVGRSSSRISHYLFSYNFLRRRSSFTSRKLLICLKPFFCFSRLSDRPYVSLARCIGLFLLCSFWHHMIGMQLFTRNFFAYCICHCSAQFRQHHGFDKLTKGILTKISSLSTTIFCTASLW